MSIIRVSVYNSNQMFYCYYFAWLGSYAAILKQLERDKSVISLNAP